MDDELGTYLQTIEDRLIGRINDAEGQIIERLRATEAALTVLTEVVRSTNTLMASLTP